MCGTDMKCTGFCENLYVKTFYTVKLLAVHCDMFLDCFDIL